MRSVAVNWLTHGRMLALLS